MSSLTTFLLTINTFNTNNYNYKIIKKEDKQITTYTEKSMNNDYNKLNYLHTKLKQRYKSYKPPSETYKKSLYNSSNDINTLLHL